MKNGPSILLIMQELQFLKSEMSALKDLSIKQTELLTNLGIPAEEAHQSAPEHTYTENPFKPTESLDFKITALLQELKMPASLKGYSLIREAIKLSYQNPDYLVGVTKNLYPVLAEKFKANASTVDRNIRTAIEVSYNRSLSHPFYRIGFDEYRPTTLQFLAAIVDKFKLEEEMQVISI